MPHEALIEDLRRLEKLARARHDEDEADLLLLEIEKYETPDDSEIVE